MSELRLRPPRSGDELALREADRRMGEDFVFTLFLDETTSWDEWLAVQLAQECSPPPDRVPGTFLLAEIDGRLIGRASIRFALNDWLHDQGGHIGYGVLPAERRRGYAHEILRQSLVIVRAHGVDPVLLTCDDDNAGSIATIERAGGVPDAQQPNFDAEHGLVRRYWVR